jgi:hypothetical protein
MDNKQTRRQHSPEDKVRILRLHLLEGKPVSEICEAEGIHPTLFYQWQKTFSHQHCHRVAVNYSDNLADKRLGGASTKMGGVPAHRKRAAARIERG